MAKKPGGEIGKCGRMRVMLSFEESLEQIFEMVEKTTLFRIAAINCDKDSDYPNVFIKCINTDTKIYVWLKCGKDKPTDRQQGIIDLLKRKGMSAYVAREAGGQHAGQRHNATMDVIGFMLYECYEHHLCDPQLNAIQKEFRKCNSADDENSGPSLIEPMRYDDLQAGRELAYYNM